jgi:hypothetical protein
MLNAIYLEDIWRKNELENQAQTICIHFSPSEEGHLIYHSSQWRIGHNLCPLTRDEHMKFSPMSYSHSPLPKVLFYWLSAEVCRGFAILSIFSA